MVFFLKSSQGDRYWNDRRIEPGWECSYTKDRTHALMRARVEEVMK